MRPRERHAGEFHPLVQNYHKGYRNREDITTLEPGVLVVGSQNVLTNVFQRVGIRLGYTLDGQRDSTPIASSVPILSSMDWKRHNGNTRHLRGGFNSSGSNGKMQYRYVAAAGDSYNGTVFTKNQVYWIDLITSVTNTLFRFADYWDNTQLISELLMVNGSSQIWEWSGGVTTLASASNAAGSISTFNQPGEITASALNAGGAAYQIGDVVTVFAGGQNAQLAVTSVGLANAVTAYSLVSGGGAYSTALNVTTSIGGGAQGGGFTIDITTVAGAGGSGYAAGDTLTATTGGAGATFLITSVSNTGGVSGITLLTPGTGYAAGVTATTTSGAGINCTINILTVATGYIQKNGTSTWAEEGFYTLQGGRAVSINGNSYTYTGGEGTTYLVGISPNPTGEAVNSVIHQVPVVTKNYNMRGLPIKFNNDFISVLKNQVYVGSATERSVFVSHLNNYKDFSFSTPRVVGQGAILTLDGSPTAFQPQKEAMYISAGKDYWFTTIFQLSSDNTKETLTVNPIKTTDNQAARSQELSCKIKNNISFVSFENIINSLGTQQNYLNDPQTQDLSYSIVNDVKNYDFSGGAITYFAGIGKYIFVAVPKETRVLMYNMTDAKDFYWEAPQVMPIQCFSIIDGEIYGHSSQASNTFKLFNGFNDDGHPTQAIATFSFMNHGTRTAYKNENKWFVEGYMSTNTVLTGSLQREVNGSLLSYKWFGTDTRIMLSSSTDASLGKQSLGKNPLGGSLIEVNDLIKFRLKQQLAKGDWIEEQPSFSTDGTDQRWEIIAFGMDAQPSDNNTNIITIG